MVRVSSRLELSCRLRVCVLICQARPACEVLALTDRLLLHPADCCRTQRMYAMRCRVLQQRNRSLRHAHIEIACWREALTIVLSLAVISYPDEPWHWHVMNWRRLMPFCNAYFTETITWAKNMVLFCPDHAHWSIVNLVSTSTSRASLLSSAQYLSTL